MRLPARFAVSVMVAALASGVHAAQFDATVFFGDSLTDSGAWTNGSTISGRFTTNVPGAQVWSEVLAGDLGTSARANNPNNPLTSTTGTNYAEGGAQVNTTPGYGSAPTTGALSLDQQVSAYLKATKGRADPKALYTVWGGANDIFYQAQFAGTVAAAATAAAGNNWALAQGTANAALAIANSTTGASQASMLAVANAAVAAANGNSLAGLASAATSAQGVAQQFSANAATQAVAEAVRLRAAGAQYLVVPNLPNIGATPGAIATGAQAAASLTALSALYNQTLTAGLQQSGLKVIALNVNALFAQVMANPKAFGITNTTTPACTTASAIQCNSNTLVSPTAPNTYLFADGVHPTVAGQKMLGEYAFATIQAPLVMAALANIPMLNARGQRDALADRFEQRRNDNIGDGLQMYADMGSGSSDVNGGAGGANAQGRDGQVFLGGDYALDAHRYWGLALGQDRGTHQFGNNLGQFDLIDTAFNLYEGVQYSQWYVRSFQQFSTLDFGNTQRQVNLGSSVETKSSTTRGQRVGLGVEGGYDLQFGAVSTGPRLGFDYYKVTVQGFGEQNVDAAAMAYGEQKLFSMVWNVGWQANAKYDHNGQIWAPFALVSWADETKTNSRQVSGGLENTPVQFSLPVAAPHAHYLNYRLGVTSSLGHWNGSLSWSGSSGENDAKFNLLNLAVGRNF